MVLAMGWLWLPPTPTPTSSGVVVAVVVKQMWIAGHHCLLLLLLLMCPSTGVPTRRVTVARHPHTDTHTPSGGGGAYGGRA